MYTFYGTRFCKNVSRFYYALALWNEVKQKPRAMRVRLKALSKASLHDIILGVQANINHERRDALWQIVYHTQHGCASIT